MSKVKFNKISELNMAQKDSIHKDYSIIKVVMTNGESVQMRSTYRDRSKGEPTLILDIDPSTHPAWKLDGGVMIDSKADAAVAFKNRFGDLDI
jgi:large subunit ribosomal protein L31